MRIAVPTAILFLVLASANALGDKIDDDLLLECRGGDELVFHISVEKSDDAKLILATGAVSGQVTVSENFYQFYFPQYSSYPNTQVIVNRLSGKFTFESGDAPFGSKSPNNAHHTGECGQASRSDSL